MTAPASPSASTSSVRPTPTDIVASRQDKTLTVTFDTGEEFVFTAEFLRVNSPSAEVQGHSPSEKQTVPGKKAVGIVDLEPVGHYAVKIVFDDLHDSGLFTWDYLLALGRDHDAIWADYLRDLEAKGLSRD